MNTGIDALLVAIEQMQLASCLRSSRWGYAAVNAAHILGIAILIGGILPLDLRLIGFWRSVERRVLARVLIPMAATGLLISVATGLLLFSIRAREYAALSIFQAKMALVLFGGISAILVHVRYGLWFDKARPGSLVFGGVMSMVCWIAALAAGRLIAFSE